MTEKPPKTLFIIDEAAETTPEIDEMLAKLDWPALVAMGGRVKVIGGGPRVHAPFRILVVPEETREKLFRHIHATAEAWTHPDQITAADILAWHAELTDAKDSLVTEIETTTPGADAE